MASITGMDGKTQKVTSQNQGNFNSVGAAGGIGWFAEKLGIFNNGCGNNGGLFGNSNNGNCYVTEKEFHYAQESAAKDSVIAKLQSEKYTDSVGLELYKSIIAETKAVDEKQSASIATINAELVKSRETVAELKSDLRAATILNEEQHKAIKADYKSAIELESERRACSDEKLLTFVESNYIKGSLKLPADDICPQVQLKCPDVQQVQIVEMMTQMQALTAAVAALAAKK